MQDSLMIITTQSKIFKCYICSYYNRFLYHHDIMRQLNNVKGYVKDKLLWLLKEMKGYKLQITVTKTFKRELNDDMTKYVPNLKVVSNVRILKKTLSFLIQWLCQWFKNG